jgi:hypothetical protein
MWTKAYFRLLSVCYLVGFALHFADVLDLRLQFSSMGLIWKSWICYLMLADFLAAVLLWRYSMWGARLVFFVATSQLIAYGFFQSYFGAQNFLIGFHMVTMLGLLIVMKNSSQEIDSGKT